MFQGIYRKFKCDYCNLEEFVDIFPKNWVWVKPEKAEPLKHACEKCKELVPKEKQRKGGQKS